MDTQEKHKSNKKRLKCLVYFGNHKFKIPFFSVAEWDSAVCGLSGDSSSLHIFKIRQFNLSPPHFSRSST
jgi:hypothetical protein